MTTSSVSSDEGECGRILTTTPWLLTSHRHLCHCLNCKKVAGSLFGTNLIIEEEKVKITGEGTTACDYQDHSNIHRQPELLLRPRDHEWDTCEPLLLQDMRCTHPIYQLFISGQSDSEARYIHPREDPDAGMGEFLESDTGVRDEIGGREAVQDQDWG